MSKDLHISPRKKRGRTRRDDNQEDDNQEEDQTRNQHGAPTGDQPEGGNGEHPYSQGRNKAERSG